jgi:ketosteroid isomerase-like protein
MNAMNDPALEQAILRYFAAIARRDLAAWLAVLSPNVTLHEPAGAVPSQGHDGAQETWKVLTAAFAELKMQVDACYFSGSGAATAWSCRAVGVNGAAADAGGITVFEFDETGLIETVVSYWDPAALLIALASAPS